MSEQYRFFEPHIPSHADILDIGFGSGRDIKYFTSKGHNVEGIDIDEEFVEYAKSIGMNVSLQNIMTFNPDKKYDAIWACASLVHISKEKLPKIFEKLKSLLKPNGVVYVSLKYGTFEGYIAEQYYTYLDEKAVESFNLNLVDMRKTSDCLNRGNEWISFIFKK